MAAQRNYFSFFFSSLSNVHMCTLCTTSKADRTADVCWKRVRWLVVYSIITDCTCRCTLGWVGSFVALVLLLWKTSAIEASDRPQYFNVSESVMFPAFSPTTAPATYFGCASVSWSVRLPSELYLELSILLNNLKQQWTPTRSCASLSVNGIFYVTMKRPWMSFFFLVVLKQSRETEAVVYVLYNIDVIVR